MNQISRLKFMNDPFGASRVAAIQIVEHLLHLEAWTPERKDAIIKSMAERDANLIEHFVIGDYDAALWHYHRIDLYAVSLTEQNQRPEPQKLRWNDLVIQLQKWVSTYGQLLMGSTETRRRLLNRHFLIAEWTGYPDAGFFILPD